METTKKQSNLKKLPYVLVISLCCVAILISLMFTALRSVIADPSIFLDFYRNNNIEQSIGISAEDCTIAITRMVDYMEGKADSIQLTVTENGRIVEMYNDQEIQHMVDVRNIYQFFVHARLPSFLSLLVVMVMIYIASSKGIKNVVLPGLYLAGGIVGSVILLCGVWVMIDFGSFWISFHHLFFTNDLWLMDYATCRMIRICPESLFYNIVIAWFLRLGMFAILIIFGSIFLDKQKKKVIDAEKELQDSKERNGEKGPEEE